MAIQDSIFDLDELFLTNLRDLPFFAYFNDDDDIQVVVIGTHLIVRIRDESFSFPIMSAETFALPEITNETFTGFAMGETFMDAQ